MFFFSFAVKIYLMIIWNLCRCRSFGIHACHVISGSSRELALVDTNLLSLEICGEIWLCLIKILLIECLIKEFIGFTVIKFQRLWRRVLDAFKQVSFHCTTAVNLCFWFKQFSTVRLSLTSSAHWWKSVGKLLSNARLLPEIYF